MLLYVTRRSVLSVLTRSRVAGALVPALPLDYESVRSYSLVVRAVDGVTGAAADALVTLGVTDVNDCAPEFTRDLYEADVSEAAAPGDLLLTLRATDNDTGESRTPRSAPHSPRHARSTPCSPAGVNGEITYSLSGDNESLALFSLDATTGSLRLAAPLDAETRSAHRLLAAAADGGRPALRSTAHVVLRVRDVNDSPPRVERAVLGARVSEEAARGTVLARVAAWDPDAADAARLRYEAVDGGGALAVDARSGLVTLAARGWPGSAPRALNVSVSDGAHAAFARVKLTVAPANRHAPRFPHLVYEARVMENLPPPALLTTVKAYDDDGGEYGTISYSIESALLRETFAIDAATGALSTRVALDREARADWALPVAARDGGGRAGHTTVRVRVLDANDHAPSFPLREYRASARHDLPPGAPFLALAAADRDAADHAALRYELYEPAPRAASAGPFRVDAASGALSFARNASEFASQTVQVWVRARDGGGRAGEAGVAVRVLGPGERAPRLAPLPPALFLREDAAPGTLLAELRPAGGPLACRLASRAPQVALEGMRLVLAGPLDREATPTLALAALCEADGAPLLLQTTLHVLDVNEHAPVFHSQPYVVHLAENTPPHSSVVQRESLFLSLKVSSVLLL
ncbi:hypothetical protein MSG28_001311 [Choristoneura fumiferana]|uniref:Uncharacterized protein n=1 Tax=Choristoneura fumiferana TaxID=7141 RepID=A0ACC0KU85_CHOFU|nr:hypothetical protein MSG28_001311 [Choristoneura fumiferana]